MSETPTSKASSSVARLMTSREIVGRPIKRKVSTRVTAQPPTAAPSPIEPDVKLLAPMDMLPYRAGAGIA